MSNRLVITIAILSVLSLVASCHKAPRQARQHAERSPLEETYRFGEIVPLADGGAYIAGDNNVFYIRDGSATLVTGLPADAQYSFSEIYALADGSALLRPLASDPPALFALRGSVARAVTPSATVATGAVGAEAGFLFAENQRLRAKISKLETSTTDSEEE
jgi:hypothetical protein